jgi:phytoene dehydrogenase-like protein
MKTQSEALFEQPEMSAMQALRRRRFSRRMVDRLFRPLIGGALLDSKLAVSARMFEFVFKMLAEGDAALPEQGMQAIPEQLAAGLPPDAIRCQARVHSIHGGGVRLVTGEELSARAVVLAVEGPEAGRLLSHDHHISSRSVCCLYFSAAEPPHDEPLLVLSGSSRGPINNLAVVNLVQPTYAPRDQYLISVTVLGWPTREDSSLVTLVRGQLRRWYGLIADDWRLVRLYRIEHGQPVTFPVHWQQEPRLSEGLYICGDHRATPSIQGAMLSGRLAAERVMEDLRGA